MPSKAESPPTHNRSFSHLCAPPPTRSAAYLHDLPFNLGSVPTFKKLPMHHPDHFRNHMMRVSPTLPLEWSGPPKCFTPVALHSSSSSYPSDDTDTEDTPTISSHRADMMCSSDSFVFSPSHAVSDGSWLDSNDSISYASTSCDKPPLYHSATPQVTYQQVSQGSGQIAFKCRQLPCRTFISTGSCPYGDRCVFLHDPSIVSKTVYIKSKRKSKEDQTVDAFFWPTMSISSVMGKVDAKNLPMVAQHYIVPAPSSYTVASSNNDTAVFSMWEHFLDYLKVDSLSVVAVPRSVHSMNPANPTNLYTGRRRLAVFIRLSNPNPKSASSVCANSPAALFYR